MLVLYPLVHYNILNNLTAYKLLFRVRTFEGSREVLSTAIFASVAFLSFMLSLRYLLKALLTYTAWMFEPRGKMSLRTKIWLVSGGIFSTNKNKVEIIRRSLRKRYCMKLVFHRLQWRFFQDANHCCTVTKEQCLNCLFQLWKIPWTG